MSFSNSFCILVNKLPSVLRITQIIAQ